MNDAKAEDALKVTSRLSVRLREISFSFVRSSGPGGQNVNKVNTKAVLRWSVATSRSLNEAQRARFAKRFTRRINQEGELILSSQRYRDQGRNRADCLEKLRQMLKEIASPPPRRKKTVAPPSADRRRLKEKQRRAQQKSLRRPPPLDE